MTEHHGPPLDVEAAWRLILALEPDGADGRRLSVAGPGGAPVLTVDPGGPWTTTTAVTPGARDLLEMLLPLRVRRRFVVAQMGQSLDGRIATASGHSHFINGPEDIRRLHRLRAMVDAVVVGAGTVAADDPRLTVREVEGSDPVRVVLDPRGRLDPERRVFRDAKAPTLWVRGVGGAKESSVPVGAEVGGEVEVLELPVDSPLGIDPTAVVALLRARGLNRILVEGGGVTVSRFLQAGALDRLHVSVAPLILGSGRPSFTLPAIETLDEGLRPPVRHFRLGTDLLFDLDLVRSPG